ncbi:MAG: hypothetical protein RL180_286 [Pseudomonadota bacterium]|jgi:hypothetical protein
MSAVDVDTTRGISITRSSLILTGSGDTPSMFGQHHHSLLRLLGVSILKLTVLGQAQTPQSRKRNAKLIAVDRSDDDLHVQSWWFMHHHTGKPQGQHRPAFSQHGMTISHVHMVCVVTASFLESIEDYESQKAIDVMRLSLTCY